MERTAAFLPTQPWGEVGMKKGGVDELDDQAPGLLVVSASVDPQA